MKHLYLLFFFIGCRAHAQQHPIPSGLSKAKHELATIIAQDEEHLLIRNTIAQVAPNSLLDRYTLLTFSIRQHAH